LRKYLEILKKCPLFVQIEEDQLLKMLSCLGAKVESFDKKYTVFFEGAPAKYIGIVLSGSVQISQVDYYGNRSILAHIGPGGLFGESYACAGVAALPISIVADEDSKLLLMDCRRITTSCCNACAFHNRMIQNLLRLVAEKNLVFDQKIQITSRRSTREKLMAYLMNQAKSSRSNTFTIPYDRQELADYLEVDRSGLSAEISKLRKEGVLKSEKNRFTLL